MIFASLLCFSFAAQQTYLDEDFSGLDFPPSAWAEGNNGNSLGWEQAASSGAMHDDFVGYNDNWLVSPTLDFRGADRIYFHAVQSSQWTTYRDRNSVSISLDGGVSFTTAYRVSRPGDYQEQPLELDLSALAGQSNVQVALRYRGDYGNEWTIHSVRIDDQPPLIGTLWPHLPSEHVAAQGWTEDFESALSGSTFAVNQLNEATREYDSRAWCNVGQLAPSQYSLGATSLEMGLAPGDPGLHFSSNALVFGLNGAGQQDFRLRFQALNHGEELDPDDGVWLSADGEVWVQVLDNWDLATGGFLNFGTWQPIELELGDAGVDLSGDFYLAFAQSDNRAYAQSDGVAIDEISLALVPRLQFSLAAAGEIGRVLVNRVLPGTTVSTLYSLKGDDSTMTPYGLLQLSQPVRLLGTRVVSVSSEVNFAGFVPARFSGMPIWMQASMAWVGDPWLSRPQSTVIP